jgi:hypothetical protein
VLDLAVIDARSSNGSALLGNGDGTFQTARTFATDSTPASVAVGDFNGDGVADLAVANLGSNTTSVLVGNGDGTFQTVQTIDAGVLPAFVAVGDLNRDGVADLAVANNGVNGGFAGSNNVAVLLGRGNGTFRAALQFGAGQNPAAVAVADVNGDGKPDLAVANYDSGSVSLLTNNTPVCDLTVSKPGNGRARSRPVRLPPARNQSTAGT